MNSEMVWTPKSKKKIEVGFHSGSGVALPYRNATFYGTIGLGVQRSFKVTLDFAPHMHPGAETPMQPFQLLRIKVPPERAVIVINMAGDVAWDSGAMRFLPIGALAVAPGSTRGRGTRAIRGGAEEDEEAEASAPEDENPFRNM